MGLHVLLLVVIYLLPTIRRDRGRVLTLVPACDPGCVHSMHRRPRGRGAAGAMVRMLAAAALLALAVDTEETEPSASPVAVPNVHQLVYQELELGVLIQYNIGLYGTKTDNYACAARAMPPSAFSPSGAIDTDEMSNMLKDVYGKKALKTNKQAQFVLEKISIMGEQSTGDMEVSYPLFEDFCNKHPA